ncbi:MAG: enoyl-CoA hydratase-related protein [Actinomycetota bacterium]|nr:enoyl-CoA hydratase-related protein [Actinomycetota bacterium]
MYDEILFEVDDPVATITLNRPQALNAWTPHMEREVMDAVGRAERDPGVVGIIITGAGRGFCAGADMQVLKEIQDRGPADGYDRGAEAKAVPGDPSWGDDLRGTYTYLMSVPKPIIACINGAVAGMGLPIALCCDLRFIAEEAVVLTAFAERGLIAEWGLSWLLPRLVGPSVALDLLFSSRKVRGPEAVALGIANRCLPADQLVAEARAYLTDVAAKCSPASLAVMKRQVYQQMHDGLGPAEKESILLMLESFERPDFREGVAAFQEKRPPSFPRIGS